MITTTMELAGLDGGRVSLAATELEELAAGVDGPLLRPGDDGWDDAVLIWNGMTATLPAAVVQPASAGGVAAAVRWAREHGVLLGVKGGGHHIAGLAIAPDGLTIDLARLSDVVVEPGAKRAHVGSRDHAESVGWYAKAVQADPRHLEAPWDLALIEYDHLRSPEYIREAARHVEAHMAERKRRGMADPDEGRMRIVRE